MSRYDQDNVDHLNLPDPVQTQAEYVAVDGTIIDRDKYNSLPEKERPKICAKKVRHIETGTTTFFVLGTGGGMMFDPRETDRRYLIRNVWKFVRVTGTTYDTYLKFLQQKYTSLLQQAQRRL